MFRIDTDGSIAGAFSDGNPQVGQEGTLVSAEWLTEFQETMCRAIELAGLALVKGNHDQLYDAIRAISIGVAGTGSGPGAVPTTRVLSAAGLITGGGDLGADRGFAVAAASSADVIAGTRTDAAVTPLALAGAFAASLGANGSSHLPGGTIFKWGGLTGTQGEGLVNVAFDQPFPNECLRVVVTAVNATASDKRDIWAQLVSKGPAGFAAFYQWTGNANVNSIDGLEYFAIGH